MTPSPVLWGQEKFRDTNNASDGYGKWFARIVAGSVRQLPYSLKVDGRTTYIVGYAYTSTGTQEPTVGNDWYPVNLDNYDNQEYASVDAYIASKDGQATLKGCGVSALVPLDTAIQRLAENDINITVHQGLYMRSNAGGNKGLLVDKAGRAVYFTDKGSNLVFWFSVSNPNELFATDDHTASIAALVQAYGLGTQLSQPPESDTVYNIDGISYTVHEGGSGIYFTPEPSAWE